jgi:hypothetical protein
VGGVDATYTVEVAVGRGRVEEDVAGGRRYDGWKKCASISQLTPVR